MSKSTQFGSSSLVPVSGNEDSSFEQQNKQWIQVSRRGKTLWLEAAPAIGAEKATERREQRSDVITRMEPPVEPVRAARAAVTQQEMRTSHADRTDAYVRRMRPLAGIGGLAVAFGAAAFEMIPFFSMAFVAVLLLACLICLVAGEIAYQVFGPDGSGILVEYWRHRRLMREQDYIYGEKRVAE